MVLQINMRKVCAAVILLTQVTGIFSSAYKITPNSVKFNPADASAPVDEFSKRSLGTNCDSSYSPTCLKLDVVSFVESLSSTGEFSVLPGLTLVKESEGNVTKTAEKVAELARSFPNDPDKRLDSYLMYKVGSFLNTHSLKFKLMDDAAADSLELSGDDDVAIGRRGGGGGFGGGGKRKKGGGKGGMGGLIAMAMMMKGTLGAIAMGGLALLAGKALMTSLLALMLSAILGLKALTSGGGHKQTTYEIVAKPTYSQSHSHSASHEDYHGGEHHHSGGGGYGRSLDIKLPEHLSKPMP